jgi:hypothetical protein
MIDPLVSLAFSVHSNPGAYALLLGSGTSRSAGIPTGYEVTLDLIRKVARLEGADPEPDPFGWYQQAHSTKPNYSGLLAALAPTQTERNALLRGYFEPTEAEAAEGIKIPKPAHHAIAELMALGYVRVVITTNFDRLPEKAAEAVGITPVVISSADAAAGAPPLTHTKTTIIKVNGDYLDTRIRNTSEELSQYEPQISTLLDKVLDEFGLLVCGWSADWDSGLRAAIERAPSRRFTTFWCLRNELTDSAKGVIALRSAVTLKVTDADSFFVDLKEKVTSLRQLSREHPLSSAVAVQSLKRYLPNPHDEIRLHDLVMQEVGKVVSAFTPVRFPFDTPPTQQEFTNRTSRYEAATEILQSLFVTGCYWGKQAQISLWVRALQRLANAPLPGAGSYYEVWPRLGYYPSLLLFYAGGIAAVAAKKYDTFAALAWRPVIRTGLRGKPGPLAASVNTGNVLSAKDAQFFNPGQSLKTPTSEHLFSALRQRFSELLPDDVEYQRAFDEFEYLVCLTFMHASRKNETFPSWPPIGSFVWRHALDAHRLIDDLSRDAEESANDWPPLKAGLFDGSIESFKAVRDELLSSELFRQLAF